LYKGKLDQKVTAREVQQSIYGTVAEESLFIRRVQFSFTTLLCIFLFYSLILFVYILVIAHFIVLLNWIIDVLFLLNAKKI